MPTFVYMTSCDGCGHCVDICPSDIMHIDKTYRRAYNIEPNMCWECYSCVKACPQNAIDCRGYADFAPMGHSVRVLREEGKDAGTRLRLAHHLMRGGKELEGARLAARWAAGGGETLAGYWREVADESPRVQLQEIGTTGYGQTMIPASQVDRILDAAGGYNGAREDVLRSHLPDLEAIIEQLEGESKAYFGELLWMAQALLDACSKT